MPCHKCCKGITDKKIGAECVSARRTVRYEEIPVCTFTLISFIIPFSNVSDEEVHDRVEVRLPRKVREAPAQGAGGLPEAVLRGERLPEGRRGEMRQVSRTPRTAPGRRRLPVSCDAVPPVLWKHQGQAARC